MGTVNPKAVLRAPSRFRLAGSGLLRIMLGGSGATYSQTGTTVTVTLTAHGFLAATDNGASIYLTQSTGALLSGMFTNFTYVDANTFTCTSTVSQSTSGNLGTQTGEITIDTFTIPGGLLGQAGEFSGWVLTQANASNANAKRVRFKLNGTAVFTPNSSNTVTAQTPFRLQNRGDPAKQIGYPTDSTTQNGGSSSAAQPYTIDTRADMVATVTMQLATATDWLKLYGYMIEAVPDF